MDPNHDALISEFCGVTGAAPTTAQSALAATNWNLSEAVTFFFASQDQPAEEEVDETEEDEAAQQARSSAPQSTQPPPSRAARPPPNQPRMRTIRDLRGGDDSEDEEDPENPDLFTGGEKSGLAVQNPNNPNNPNPADHFNNIIQQAQQNRPRPGGARPGGEADEPAQGPRFTGRGQTLGGDEEPSRVIDDTSAAARPTTFPRVQRVLHLWQDGFSVDDGPLYRFDDPANDHTLALINQGRAPLALLGVQPGQEVDLQLNPHRDEKYVQPKQKYKAFGGSGNRLGSPTPGASGASSGTTPAQPAVAAPATAAASSSSASAPKTNADESQPTIQLQIRLGDGSRTQGRFNTTQTIGDVYNFVNASNTASTTRSYALMTTFPSKELSDKSVVLGDLSEFKRGGVVVQKWT